VIAEPAVARLLELGMTSASGAVRRSARCLWCVHGDRLRVLFKLPGAGQGLNVRGTRILLILYVLVPLLVVAFIFWVGLSAR
jgi:hypothetical protein